MAFLLDYDFDCGGIHLMTDKVIRPSSTKSRSKQGALGGLGARDSLAHGGPKGAT